MNHHVSFINQMKPENNLHQQERQPVQKAKTAVFLSEIGLILILLAIWFTSDSIHNSTSLVVLFFYSFPSEFLVGLVPHEPVLLYFGEFYSPLTVTLIAVSSTVLAEALNYSVFKYVADSKLFKKFTDRKIVRVMVGLFNKSPFLAIWIAGFTPIPFYPFRFLVVISRYPVMRYLLAVFLSRAPRFYILAYIGETFKIPGSVLLALFIILIVAFNIPVIGNLFKKTTETRPD